MLFFNISDLYVMKMALDDEFDILCMSFEERTGSQVVPAIGDNKDSSDVMDEFDSFLEDDNESDVDKKEFQPKSSIVSTLNSNISLKSSSPINSITPLTCPIAPTPSGASPPPPASGPSLSLLTPLQSTGLR
jgi:hypothetical protein